MKKNQNDVPTITCCICKRKVQEYGCNPRPLAGRLCCNRCDKNIVIPIREFMMQQGLQ